MTAHSTNFNSPALPDDWLLTGNELDGGSGSWKLDEGEPASPSIFAFTSLAGGNVKLKCNVDANVVVQGEGGPAIKPSTRANPMRGNSPARVPLLVL